MKTNNELARMKNLVLLFFIIPFMVLSQEPIAEIDSICKMFLADSGVAGFSIAISKNDDLFFASGYGHADREKDEMASPETIYPLASVSKLFTAVAIMKLVDKKLLRLEDPVMDIVPSFPKQKYMDRITVDHMLRHTSGLVDYGHWGDSLFLSQGLISDRQFVNFIDKPLLFKPGTSFAYSNSGFRTLSLITEKLSGLSFHDFIVKEIAEPMNMKSLGDWPHNLERNEATINYKRIGDSLLVGTVMDIPYDDGDGGLSASVVDIVKLPGLLSRQKLIPKKLLDNMLMPTDLGRFKVDYGTGVRLGEILGHKVWGHTGGASGSTVAKLSHFSDDNISLAILINTLETPKNALDLEEALLPILLKVDKPKTVALPDNLQRYTGSFVRRDRWGGAQASTRVISEKEGELFRDNPLTETPGQQLFYLGEDLFRNDFYPFDYFKFHFESGKVIACSEYVNGVFFYVLLNEN